MHAAATATARDAAAGKPPPPVPMAPMQGERPLRARRMQTGSEGPERAAGTASLTAGTDLNDPQGEAAALLTSRG